MTCRDGVERPPAVTGWLASTTRARSDIAGVANNGLTPGSRARAARAQQWDAKHWKSSRGAMLLCSGVWLPMMVAHDSRPERLPAGQPGRNARPAHPNSARALEPRECAPLGGAGAPRRAERVGCSRGIGEARGTGTSPAFSDGHGPPGGHRLSAGLHRRPRRPRGP